MEKQKVIVPIEYDTFVNKQRFDEDFERIFREESKEDIEESLNDELPI